ncbi:hypothetical protein I6F07_09305 [Ensifer sp. IC4062]|nr:hypothetical protein [Ensifer sp. IC4062]MCA1440405.1 hypothetical protein [Ensifer sp. IC4062]
MKAAGARGRMRFDKLARQKTLSAIAILFAATIMADDLLAHEKEIVAHFRNFNPPSRHTQFRGVKINILYSCVEATDVSQKDTCGRVHRFVASQDSVVFISRKHINALSLNFFVTKSALPKERIWKEFDNCLFRRGPSSVVVLNPGGDEESFGKCILATTLVHLGFSVDDFVYQGLNVASFKRIVSSYTLEN